MGVTVSSVNRAQYAAAIERLANSRVLHGSESLCKLLRYLAEHSLQNPGVPIKEYQIATEVFGRPPDFDPHLDSAIRVQAGRLRLKLAEYYSFEGERDPIIVEIPKGSYTITFHARAVASAPVVAPTDTEPARKRRDILLKWALGVIALSILLAAAVAALVVKWENHLRSDAASGRHPPIAGAYQTFWKGFVAAPAEPWVVFSNAEFVGRPESGMRYRNPVSDANALILDHYTGVGEVLAVHELDHVFHLFSEEIRVKRGSLFSLDDAKDNALIFVGSPAENLSLRDIPMSQQFVFQRLASGPRKGDLAVRNLHPSGSEPPYFLGSPPNVPLSEDYAVISFLKGLTTNSVLILAGTSTIGTQAAVEYVCHEDSLNQLLTRLGAQSNTELKPFEVVLRVKVARGVPVESDIVALRHDGEQ